MNETLMSSTPEISLPAWVPLPIRRFIHWQIGPSLGTPSNYIRAIFSLIMVIPIATTALGAGHCFALRVGLFSLGTLSLSAALFLLYRERLSQKLDLSSEAFFSMVFSVQVFRILRSDGFLSALPYCAVWVLTMLILYRFLVPLWDRNLQKELKQIQGNDAK